MGRSSLSPSLSRISVSQIRQQYFSKRNRIHVSGVD